MPKPSNLYLGVDPGKKGGVALINDDLQIVDLAVMPSSGGKLYQWLCYHLLRDGNVTVTLERVHSMAGQGAQSTFTFGMELGKCESVLDILRYKREDMELGSTNILVPKPQEWMKALPIKSKVNDFETKTLWKRYLRSVARGLFPKAELWTNPWWNEGRTDAVSDALLIAYYGWLNNR